MLSTLPFKITSRGFLNYTEFIIGYAVSLFYVPACISGSPYRHALRNIAYFIKIPILIMENYQYIYYLHI